LQTSALAPAPACEDAFKFPSKPHNGQGHIFSPPSFRPAMREPTRGVKASNQTLRHPAFFNYPIHTLPICPVLWKAENKKFFYDKRLSPSPILQYLCALNFKRLGNPKKKRFSTPLLCPRLESSLFCEVCSRLADQRKTYPVLFVLQSPCTNFAPRLHLCV